MIILKTFLENLMKESGAEDKLFKRNLLKEYLQIVVLDFIYAHPKYSKLIFYGGSCLRHCFGLPRLSEDLDFVDLEKNVSISQLAKDLEDYFKNETDIAARVLVQPSRIKLSFPILRDLGLAGFSDSDLLLLKVEVFQGFDFCKNYEVSVTALFKINRSVLVKTFDLPTMMATKIGAVLNRKWEKTAKGGKVLAVVKGRDYFDLMWYLNKNIAPNLKCFMDDKDIDNLKTKLLSVIGKVDLESIRYDLEHLIEDNNFVENLSKNIKDILIREITMKL